MLESDNNWGSGVDATEYSGSCGVNYPSKTGFYGLTHFRELCLSRIISVSEKMIKKKVI